MHNGQRQIAQGAALAVLAAAGLASAHAGPGVTAIGPVRRLAFPRLAGLGRPDHVALTFDDGPDPASTPAFLDLLAARRLHATFFLLGSMVARAPQLAAEIAAAGHEIAVHGWDHRYTILRGPRAVFSDLARASDAVAGVTGARPRFFRPPYGVLSSGAVIAARRLELTPVLWSSWGREWAPGATPTRCSRRWWPTSPAARRSCFTTLTAPPRRGPPRRRSARCPGCWTSARPGGWPWGPWPTTVSGERFRVSGSEVIMAARRPDRPPVTPGIRVT